MNKLEKEFIEDYIFYCLLCLFITIGFNWSVGLVSYLLVLYIMLTDKKYRRLVKW